MLHYAAKYPLICVHCAKDVEWKEKEYYRIADFICEVLNCANYARGCELA